MKKILFLLPLVFLVSACTSDALPGKSVPKESRTIESPRQGSGSHELMVFADFQCPACQSFSENVEPIFLEYVNSGKLTIVYKQFPLTSIHKNAFGDAMAALCSAEQGRYVPYKKALYALEKSKAMASVSNAERIKLAKDTGLDETSFTQCLESEAYKDQVNREMAEGDALKISGTPTLFLDGKKLDLSVFRGDVTIMRTFLDNLTAR